jgi:hypothetical protein
MADLLDFAAKTLFLNGRLVYLLPTNEEFVVLSSEITF